MDALEKAKKMISDFCKEEYGNDTDDFSNLEEIGLAYTTITDDELDIQVYADLIHYQIRVEIEGKNIPELTTQYNSLEEMIDKELEYLDFDSLISVPDSVLEKIEEEYKDR